MCFGGEFDIKKKRSKFNVDTTKKGKQNRTFQGIVYDSETEMKFFRDVLYIQMQEGKIKNVDRQVKYELQPKFTYKGKTILPINYVADFVVTYADNSVIVYEVKGLADSIFKLKSKIFRYKYPDLEYKCVGYVAKYGGWLDYHEIERLRSKNKKEKKNNE